MPEESLLTFAQQLTDLGDFNSAFDPINQVVKHFRGSGPTIRDAPRESTNGIENFWSLLKRTLGGTYISVEPFHLFRYLDEQSFRFNSRKLTDGERFSIVAKQIVGRRLTLAEVTGKTDSRQPV